MVDVSTTRVRTAHGDAWQVQGRRRAAHGGGTAEVRDLRLMASGLPDPQWNNGDVTGSDPDLSAAAEFYAERQAAWGIRVPLELKVAAGRWLFRKRLMGLPPKAFRPAPEVPDAHLRVARASDLEAVLAVDALAFESDPQVQRGWLEPLLHWDEATVVLALTEDTPAATAYSLRSDGRAGPCLYLAGVAVLPQYRRRGLGGLVSSWLLERGFSSGAELAHLHPDTDDAARIYTDSGSTRSPGLTSASM